MITLTQLDVDTFIKQLEEYDSAKCTSSHLGSSNGVEFQTSPCSIDAVARMTAACTQMTVLWCQSRLDFYYVRKNNAQCGPCERMQSECWTVLPV